MRFVFGAITSLMLMASLVLGQSAAPARGYLDLPGADLTYPYKSIDQPLGDALRAFARNLQIAIKIDENVSGTIVESDQNPTSRRAYIDRLADEFEFVWYFDGIVLHVVDVAGFETAVIPLRNTSGLDAIDLLIQLEIYQEKFMHRADAKNNALMVMGPVAYVEVVRQAVDSIEQSDRKTVTLLRGLSSDELGTQLPFDPGTAAETVDPTN